MVMQNDQQAVWNRLVGRYHCALFGPAIIPAMDEERVKQAQWSHAQEIIINDAMPNARRWQTTPQHDNRKSYIVKLWIESSELFASSLFQCISRNANLAIACWTTVIMATRLAPIASNRKARDQLNFVSTIYVVFIRTQKHARTCYKRRWLQDYSKSFWELWRCITNLYQKQSCTSNSSALLRLMDAMSGGVCGLNRWKCF